MRKLLKEFGSSTLVRQATEEELAKRVGPRPQRRKSARITCVGQRRSPARFRSQRRDGGTAFRKKQRKVEIHTPQRGQKSAMLNLAQTNAKHSFHHGNDGAVAQTDRG